MCGKRALRHPVVIAEIPLNINEMKNYWRYSSSMNKQWQWDALEMQWLDEIGFRLWKMRLERDEKKRARARLHTTQQLHSLNLSETTP